MSHKVTIEASGKEFLVEPGESVLDAALRAKLGLPFGCRNGSCRSCRGRVLEGAIDYPHGLPSAIKQHEADAGWALFCQAVPDGDLLIDVPEIDSAKNIRVRTLPCRLMRKEQLAHDVMLLRLQLPDTERLQFLAGQYVEILLRDGRRRAFSLANPPQQDEALELHIRYLPGGQFSEYVFSHLRERSLLRMRGPLGGFFLRDSTRPLIFVAGGTGFAPIKSIIESALAEGQSRPITLYWGVRALRDLYMPDLPRQWQASHEHLSFVPVLSEPDPQDGWTGRSGFVHQAVLEDFGDLSGFEVYTCGPPVMVDAARDAFSARGLDAAHLYSDAFEFAYAIGYDTTG